MKEKARFSLADQDSSISNLSRELLKKQDLKFNPKLGERGIVSLIETQVKIKEKIKKKLVYHLLVLQQLILMGREMHF